MNLTKEQIYHTIKLINSSDEETKNLGFSIFEKLNIKKEIGEILIISSLCNEEFMAPFTSWNNMSDEQRLHHKIVTNRKKFAKILSETDSLLSGELFSYMLDNKSSDLSKTIFIENFITRLQDVLKTSKFKKDQFEITIKILP